MEKKAAKSSASAHSVQKIIAGIVVVVVISAAAYFIVKAKIGDSDIPAYVGGEKREIYAWAKSEEGRQYLEQVPCYCGCKYQDHKHARHCFWRDDGTFDKHGLTCSVCFDISTKVKQMVEEGKGICEIRKTIDDFYAPNAHLGTETPMPAQCV